MRNQSLSSQNALQRCKEIIKYHGLVRGTRRVVDQIFQVEIYDWVNSIETRSMLSGDDFFAALGGAEAASAMHYQPAYTATIRQPTRLMLSRPCSTLMATMPAPSPHGCRIDPFCACCCQSCRRPAMLFGSSGGRLA